MKKMLIAAFIIVLDLTGVTSLVTCSRGSEARYGQEPKTLIPNLEKGDALSSINPGGSPLLLLRNVRFRLSDDVYLDARELLARALPRAPHRVPDMNNIHSMIFELLHGCALVDMPVIERMFNRALGAPGSSIRNIGMTVIDWETKTGIVKRFRVTGSIRLGLWLDFELITTPSVDHGKNMLVIESERIRVLGISSIKGLLEMTGLSLAKLVTLPPGCGIEIRGNRILIDAFALLPPPRLSGPIRDVRIEEERIAVYIGGSGDRANPRVLDPSAKNFMYMEGGSLYFGNMGVFGGRIQINDADESDIFDFYLRHYLLAIEKGQLRMSRHNHLRILMPDFDDAMRISVSSR